MTVRLELNNEQENKKTLSTTPTPHISKAYAPEIPLLA